MGSSSISTCKKKKKERGKIPSTKYEKALPFCNKKKYKIADNNEKSWKKEI